MAKIPIGNLVYLVDIDEASVKSVEARLQNMFAGLKLPPINIPDPGLNDKFNKPANEAKQAIQILTNQIRAAQNDLKNYGDEGGKTAARLENLRDKALDLSKTLDRNSNEYIKLDNSVTSANKTLGGLNSKLSNLGNSFQFVRAIQESFTFSLLGMGPAGQLAFGAVNGLTGGVHNYGNATKAATTSQLIFNGIVLASGAAFVGIVAAITQAGSVFSQYEYNLKAASQTLQASKQEIIELGNQALNTAPKLGVLPVQFGKTLEELGSQGISAREALDGISKSVVELGNATGVSFTIAAEIAGQAKNAFGLGAAEFDKATDVIVNAANQTSLKVEDFTYIIGQAGASAKLAGLDFTDLTSVIAITRANFGSASDAGTSFKAFINGLSPNSKPAIAAMKEIGFSAYTSTGQMKEFTDIVDNLRESLANVTPQKKQEILETLFGSDGIRTAIALLETTGEKIKEMNAQLSVTGSRSNQAAERLNTLNGDVKILLSTVQALGVEFGEKLSPAMRGAVQTLTGFVDVVRVLMDYFPLIVAGAASFALAIYGPAGITAALALATGAIVTFKGLYLAAMIEGATATRAMTLAITGGLIPSLATLKSALLASGLLLIAGAATAAGIAITDTINYVNELEEQTQKNTIATDQAILKQAAAYRALGTEVGRLKAQILTLIVLRSDATLNNDIKKADEYAKKIADLRVQLKKLEEEERARQGSNKPKQTTPEIDYAGTLKKAQSLLDNLEKSQGNFEAFSKAKAALEAFRKESELNARALEYLEKRQREIEKTTDADRIAFEKWKESLKALSIEELRRLKAAETDYQKYVAIQSALNEKLREQESQAKKTAAETKRLAEEQLRLAEAAYKIFSENEYNRQSKVIGDGVAYTIAMIERTEGPFKSYEEGLQKLIRTNTFNGDTLKYLEDRFKKNTEEVDANAEAIQNLIDLEYDELFNGLTELNNQLTRTFERTVDAVERTEGKFTSVEDALNKLRAVGVNVTGPFLQYLKDKFDDMGEAALDAANKVKTLYNGFDPTRNQNTGFNFSNAGLSAISIRAQIENSNVTEQSLIEAQNNIQNALDASDVGLINLTSAQRSYLQNTLNLIKDAQQGLKESADAVIKSFEDQARASEAQANNLISVQRARIDRLRNNDASPQRIASDINNSIDEINEAINNLDPANPAFGALLRAYTNQITFLKDELKKLGDQALQTANEVSNAYNGFNPTANQTVKSSQAVLDTLTNLISLGNGGARGVFDITEGINQAKEVLEQIKGGTYLATPAQIQAIENYIKKLEALLKMINEPTPGDSSNAGRNRRNDRNSLGNEFDRQGVTLGGDPSAITPENVENEIKAVSTFVRILKDAYKNGIIDQQTFNNGLTVQRQYLDQLIASGYLTGPALLEAQVQLKELDDTLNDTEGTVKSTAEALKLLADAQSLLNDLNGISVPKYETLAKNLEDMAKVVKDPELQQRLQSMADALRKSGEAAEEVKKFKESVELFLDITNGIASVIKGVNEIAKGGQSATQVIGSLTSIASTIGDVVGPLVGLPFLGQVIDGVGSLISSVVGLVESAFDPLANQVRALAENLQKSISSSISSGIEEAIKKGDYENLGDSLSEDIYGKLFSTFIQLFTDRILMEGILNGPLAEFSRALITPNKDDDKVATDNLKKAFQDAKQIIQQYAPELVGFAEEFGLDGSEAETEDNTSRSTRKPSYSNRVPDAFIQTAIGSDFRAANIMFAENMVLFGNHVNKFGLAVETFKQAIEQLNSPSNGALRYD